MKYHVYDIEIETGGTKIQSSEGTRHQGCPSEYTDREKLEDGLNKVIAPKKEKVVALSYLNKFCWRIITTSR